MLANSRGLWSQVNAVDAERVQALEAAVGALAEDDRRRAQVLALLACELHYAGEPACCRALAEQAIEIARAAGDPVALADTLAYALFAIWGPGELTERERLTEELVELTNSVGDPSLSFRAASRSTVLGTEAGERARVESGFATMRALAASVPEPSIAHLRLMHEAGWAVVQGELEAAEQWNVQMFEVGRASGQPDAAAWYGALLFHLRNLQGRLAELVEPSVRLAADPDSRSAWRAAAALALIESAREDEARELALAEDFTAVPWDVVWSVAMFMWAEVCTRLGAIDRATTLYELLEPFSGRLAVSGPSVYGSIDRALGTLASTLGRYEQAERYFAAAAEIEQRLGAPLFLARTRASWARALIARGRPEDRERAQTMLEQAEEVAERLGAGGITQEVAECRAALAAFSG